MKKWVLCAIVCAFIIPFSINTTDAFTMPHLLKNLLKKKIYEEKPQMPITVEDWEEEAKNIPLLERDIKNPAPPKTDKKNYYPEPNYVFELYNYPQGTIEYNLTTLKTNLVYHPIMVSDRSFNYVAYANYYYSSDNDMIYSDFYIGKLDKTKSKLNRILDFAHKQNPLQPILIAGLDEYYPHLYKGLTLVDWSYDSKKILIKERVGSTIEGVYRTYLYVYDFNSQKARKLTDFDEYIKNYLIKNKGISITTLKYDVVPLGFAKDNDNLVVSQLFLYTQEGERVFMGLWGYDVKGQKTELISLKNPQYEISTNGLVLKKVLE